MHIWSKMAPLTGASFAFSVEKGGVPLGARDRDNETSYTSQ